jgi:hypothetical protein
MTHTSGKQRRRKIATGTTVVALVMLAACSGSSASSKPTTPSTIVRTTTTVTAPLSKTVWLCRPGLPSNPCTAPLDATVVAANGSRTTEPAAPANDPAVDCFYVYPTVSAQATPVANLQIDPEERAIAVAQASRFSQVCKVYAPMYRQATLAAITGAAKQPRGGGLPLNVGYLDVLNAWRDYLAHDNNGRGVVLIGHSQGSAVLIKLIQSEIDNNPTVRDRLVSAILLGGNVTVPVGRDVGGDFQHIPVCDSASQNGCVVAYSSFLTPPPPNSLFGRPATGPRAGSAGSASGAGLQVVCVNPADPGRDSGSLLHTYTPTAKFPGPIGAVSGPVPSAPTPWIAYPDRYTAHCASANGATWLQITPTATPGDTRPVVTQTLGPTWGLHLYDVNLALGDLVNLVRHQAAAHR